ncbi:hypothetical protein M407DRAFT_28097 [Tulasnella calospora MUT 4182]|uniref:F-box domain-containing protein n=1 Tax=Tulasnella calospora MUT 4182 TaxID=1051891 RepID=A0A0C3KM13_9AGAM|nr:hypothetical protein M407DRAFT_28097 [Tulasnella calospora MUT 4182]
MNSSNEGTTGLQDQQLPRPSIHDLPVELLSHIISLSVHEYFANLTRTQHLCLVCSKWRDVVEGTPELWCCLTGEDPLPGVRKAIHYSRDYPLDINYNYTPPRHGPNPNEFLAAVSLHARRWRRASIVVCRLTEDLLQALTVVKAPRLESLTIIAYGDIRRPLTLFLGATLPCLRILRLHGTRIVWNGEQFFNLRKLEIVQDQETFPTLDAVLSVLRITQGLEEFTCVGSLSRALDGDRITAPQHSVLLPALKTLKVHSYTAYSWLDLSRRIRAPACQHVSLSGDFPGDLEDPNKLAEIAEGILRFFPCSRKAVDWEEHVHITVGASESKFSSSTHDLVLSHSTQRIQLTKWMILNLADELVEITLHINDPTWNADQLEMLDVAILRRKVSKLDIGICTPVWQRRAILKYLSSPNPCLDGQTRWSLPDLTEVALPVADDDLPLILRVLRGRAQAIDLPGSVRPQNVIKLHLSEQTIDSLETTEILAEIDNLVRGNGGSLTILPRMESTPGLQDQQLPRLNIQDLPVELLSHIISLSVQEYPAHLTRTQNLCLVCSKWRDVVEGSPELWCRLTGADPLPGVMKAIQSSRDSPLDIDFNSISHTGSDPHDFFSAVAVHVWRWRRASIAARSRNFLQALTIEEAPQLESLTITAHDLMKAPFTLFQGATLPCLRTLELRRTPIVWNGEQLFNLRKLEIIGKQRPPPPLNAVLSVLQATQALEEFTCTMSLSRALDGNSTPTRQHPILLPTLKTLCIYTSRSPSWLDLSRAIQAPACRYATLGGDILGDLEDLNNLAQVAQGISHLFPSVPKTPDREERVSIEANSEQVTLNSSTLRLVFSHPTQTTQLTKWMILNFVDEAVEIDLRLNDSTWNADQLEMLDLPTLRRKISKLDVSVNVWGRRTILDYLSSPKPGFNSQPRWPLPDLTEVALAVTDADDLPVILRMLRSRAQAIDLPGSIRLQNNIQLILSEFGDNSLGNTEILAEIDSFLKANGGSLTIERWEPEADCGI